MFRRTAKERPSVLSSLGGLVDRVNKVSLVSLGPVRLSPSVALVKRRAALVEPPPHRNTADTIKYNTIQYDSPLFCACDTSDTLSLSAA